MKLRRACVDCPDFERGVWNMGFCRRYRWEVWMELARKERVCVEE